jgi:tight adherence protein C
MVLLLLLGAGLLLAAVVLALPATGGAPSRGGVAASLASIRALDLPVATDASAGPPPPEPFAQRVIAPLGDRFLSLGRRLTRAGAAERIQHRLDVAGNPAGWDVQRIIGVKALGLVVLGAVTFLYGEASGLSPLMLVLITGAVGALGFLLPDILVYNAGTKRETLMKRALPDALDLLTISVEAGLGFEAAVLKVAQNTVGPLAQEFSRLLQEMQIGTGRADAMRAMADRSTMKELRSFCLAMVQADQLGVPIGGVLRIQSREMRVKRRQSAEERAQQVPVKIMVPLVLFVLPCLFIVVIGPAAIQMMKVFS